MVIKEKIFSRNWTWYIIYNYDFTNFICHLLRYKNGQLNISIGLQREINMIK